MVEGSVLVAGASGFIGRALVPALLERGVARVRVLARQRERLPQGPRFEAVAADVLQPEAMEVALRGVEVAYYLIHSMHAADFAQRDVHAARSFAQSAARAGVRRILFLGAMSGGRSEHLRSRYETGQALRSGGVPVTELGAAVVVGAGSAVFELIRHLVERMPAIVCPRGASTRTQPIALADVVRYLVAALEEPRTTGLRLDIGGDEVLSYRELMRAYARVRGLARPIVDLPVEAHRLGAFWLDALGAVPASMALQLVRGMTDELVLRDTTARALLGLKHQSLEEALAVALAAATPLPPVDWPRAARRLTPWLLGRGPTS